MAKVRATPDISGSRSMMLGVRQKCGAEAFSQVALLVWSRMSQPDRNVLVSEVRQAMSPASSPSEGTVTTRQT